jgi:hypothetical protein
MSTTRRLIEIAVGVALFAAVVYMMAFVGGM